MAKRLVIEVQHALLLPTFSADARTLLKVIFLFQSPYSPGEEEPIEAQNHLSELRSKATADQLIVHDNASRAQSPSKSSILESHNDINLVTDTSLSQNGGILEDEANTSHSSTTSSMQSLPEDKSDQRLPNSQLLPSTSMNPVTKLNLTNLNYRVNSNVESLTSPQLLTSSKLAGDTKEIKSPETSTTGEENCITQLAALLQRCRVFDKKVTFIGPVLNDCNRSRNSFKQTNSEFTRAIYTPVVPMTSVHCEKVM
ncbi:unnamed protein product [Arctia plantaginis]|uniref:Uncharacterized protein n=1 Tax=Arctia plantaginis TaxID=874455 RepID=A0A8S0YTH0_ARCPL|nr:unnamed protein product [Arctia plantaginis]